MKLLLLTVLLALTVRYPVPMLVPLLSLYLLARIPWRVALAQVRPLWMLLLVTGAFQVLTLGWVRAVDIVCGLLVSVALAGLVTLTTRVNAMLDVLVRVLRPLRLVGVDPTRVALLLALTIRCVPMLAGIVTAVREAQLARGAGRNPLALAVPVVIRTLRAADALGEALTARGADD
ncbi:energy-coupling factor transporter transmembrane component T family protein [Virgisporangium aurantiacum]|uniref:energy-coupling factor transporter transmembrane component T family protein n=1 Tax=Virgisporangium aurantiacum TaxID=175570 RepID=UPI00194E5605|nr:energy-coupling factor transporter transmembrane protein EcfT [Virgisporangium aurantiacum]